MPSPRSIGAWAPRLSSVLLASVILVLTVATPAGAHTDRGVAGSNFAGQVLRTSAEMPGVSLRVTEFGDSLELLNGSSATVTVFGYSEEPYLRIGPGGVWRNASSPATYLNLARDGNVNLPAPADPRADPDWRQVSTHPEYSWHDHRTHWMLDSPPPQVVADPDSEHTIIEWQVPVAYDGLPVTVDGELTWSPPPMTGLWWPLYLLVGLAGALAAGFLSRSPRPLALLLALVTAAATWHLLATPQPGLTAAGRALAMGTASLPTLAVAGITIIGVRAAFRGNGLLAGMLAAIAGFMHFVQGLPDMDVLWSANVLTGGPAPLARMSVALLIFGGLGLMLGSVGAVRRFRPQPPEPTPEVRRAAAPT